MREVKPFMGWTLDAIQLLLSNEVLFEMNFLRISLKCGGDKNAGNASFWNFWWIFFSYLLAIFDTSGNRIYINICLFSWIRMRNANSMISICFACDSKMDLIGGISFQHLKYALFPHAVRPLHRLTIQITTNIQRHNHHVNVNATKEEEKI